MVRPIVTVEDFVVVVVKTEDKEHIVLEGAGVNQRPDGCEEAAGRKGQSESYNRGQGGWGDRGRERERERERGERERETERERDRERDRQTDGQREIY